MHKLIGLVGRKQSGKDTAAVGLRSHGYTRISFADPLKDMLRAQLRYMGCPLMLIERMLDGNAKEVPTDYFCGKTPRHAMQTIGTEWGRKLIDQDIWVRAALLRARHFDNVVITDVRFPNEERAVHKAGGIVVRIIREQAAGNSDPHASETLIDTLCTDHNINNNGTREELHHKILRIAGIKP